MGNVVKTLSKNVFKKVRRFNIENRTDRFLDKKVKVVPPKPQATLLEIQKINREMPDLMKQINEPNPQLLDRLKNVYVSSTDKLPDCSTSSEDPRKQLPVQRTSLRESFGYVEPTSLTPGRISLQEALKLLVKYYQDKKANNPQRLALQFNLSEKNVESILENFKLFSYVDTDPKKIQIGVPLGNMMKSLEADPINTINYPQKLIELNAKAKSPTLNTLQGNQVEKGQNVSADEKESKDLK